MRQTAQECMHVAVSTGAQDGLAAADARSFDRALRRLTCSEIRWLLAFCGCLTLGKAPVRSARGSRPEPKRRLSCRVGTGRRTIPLASNRADVAGAACVSRASATPATRGDGRRPKPTPSGRPGGPPRCGGAGTKEFSNRNYPIDSPRHPRHKPTGGSNIACWNLHPPHAPPG